MGTIQSKPRMRRCRRFSSLRKRQGPEGAHEPEPFPIEKSATWNHYSEMNSRGQHNAHTYNPDKKCTFCQNSNGCNNAILKKDLSKVEDGVSGGQLRGIQHREDEKSFLKEFLGHSDLNVDLPPPPYSSCRKCDSCRKSKTLPSNLQAEKVKLSEKDEQEWTITLYEIDKLSGRVPREDMLRLMSSIYDAVDTKVVESPQGRKTVRVRLSVTPEPRKVQRTTSGRDALTPHRNDGTSCQCPECPNTEPTSRRLSSNSRIRRHQSDVSREVGNPYHASKDQLKNRVMVDGKQHCTVRERSRQSSTITTHPTIEERNNNRRWHYSKSEGIEKDEFSPSMKRDLSKDRAFVNEFNHRQHKSDEARNAKLEEIKALKGSKNRPRYNANEHRNVLLRTRKKDPRFASPYDQHFQEAMYLRLRELQRKGSYEVRRATGQPGDGDEADDDSSDSEYEVEKKENEHLSTEVCDKKATRGFSKSPANDVEAIDVITKQTLTPIDSVDHIPVTNVHYHHHYHHGLPSTSVMSALCPTDTGDKETDSKSPGVEPTSSPHLPPPYSRSSETSQTNTASSGQRPYHHYHHHYHHTDKF